MGPLTGAKVLEVRGEDVPFWVERLLSKGKNAVGFTGQDLFEEYTLSAGVRGKVDILKVFEWNDPKAMFGKPALCLIGPSGKALKNMPKTLNVWIAAKYKNIADRYLAKYESQGYTFNKEYVNGCVETSCSEGMADIIIDIVYTGSSLKKFGLGIYEKIFESDFLMVGKGASP
jgi:ATP phosphoribosyltransferase